MYFFFSWLWRSGPPPPPAPRKKKCQLYDLSPVRKFPACEKILIYSNSKWGMVLIMLISAFTCLCFTFKIHTDSCWTQLIWKESAWLLWPTETTAEGAGETDGRCFWGQRLAEFIIVSDILLWGDCNCSVFLSVPFCLCMYNLCNLKTNTFHGSSQSSCISDCSCQNGGIWAFDLNVSLGC